MAPYVINYVIYRDVDDLKENEKMETFDEEIHIEIEPVDDSNEINENDEKINENQISTSEEVAIHTTKEQPNIEKNENEKNNGKEGEKIRENQDDPMITKEN